MQIMCCVSPESCYCTAGQDAPPTGLVLYGFPSNPIVILFYKVEIRTCLRIRWQDHVPAIWRSQLPNFQVINLLDVPFPKGTSRNPNRLPINMVRVCIVTQGSAIIYGKVHAKTKISLQFRLGEYAASRQHGDSRVFQVGGRCSTVKCKGVPQMWTQFGEIWLKRPLNPCLTRVCARCHKCGQKSEMWHPFEG